MTSKKRPRHIDDILTSWPYDPEALAVRRTRGHDGRPVLQMRIEMGLLQLEVSGRPDGSKPYGKPTVLDHVRGEAERAPSFVLSDELCREIDREFVQFYHRRICWLRLQEYHRAVEDADHTLALMDFCREHSDDTDWILSHEQYRPFVLFHRTQADALAALDDDGPEAAITRVNSGLERLHQFYAECGAEDEWETDELAARLREVRENLRQTFEVGLTLEEQLAEAVAREEYERAAELRDELARRHARQ